MLIAGILKYNIINVWRGSHWLEHRTISLGWQFDSAPRYHRNYETISYYIISKQSFNKKILSILKNIK